MDKEKIEVENLEQASGGFNNKDLNLSDRELYLKYKDNPLMLTLINGKRAEQGLPPLTSDVLNSN